MEHQSSNYFGRSLFCGFWIPEWHSVYSAIELRRITGLVQKWISPVEPAFKFYWVPVERSVSRHTKRPSLMDILARRRPSKCFYQGRMTMSSENPKSIDDILTEKELIELLGIKKTALDDLRRSRKLPFCKISKTNRIYLVMDVLNFIASRRIILNADAD